MLNQTVPSPNTEELGLRVIQWLSRSRLDPLLWEVQEGDPLGAYPEYRANRPDEHTFFITYRRVNRDYVKNEPAFIGPNFVLCQHVAGEPTANSNIFLKANYASQPGIWAALECPYSSAQALFGSTIQDLSKTQQRARNDILRALAFDEAQERAIIGDQREL